MQDPNDTIDDLAFNCIVAEYRILTPDGQEFHAIFDTMLREWTVVQRFPKGHPFTVFTEEMRPKIFNYIEAVRLYCRKHGIIIKIVKKVHDPDN